MTGDLQAGGTEYIQSILTSEEQAEFSRAQILATAEAILGVAALMQMLDVEPEAIKSATVALRERLQILPLHTVHAITGQLLEVGRNLTEPNRIPQEITKRNTTITTHVLLSGASTMGTHEDVDASNDEAPAAESLVDTMPHPLDKPEVEPGRDTSAQAALIHDTPPEPLNEEKDEGEQAVPLSEIPPALSNDIAKINLTPSAARSHPGETKNTSTAGLRELTWLFKDVLDPEKIAALQKLDIEQQQKFIVKIQQIYESHSRKPRYGNLQAQRIGLYMDGFSSREVAVLLSQTPTSIEQSFQTVPKIIRRAGGDILQAFEECRGLATNFVKETNNDENSESLTNTSPSEDSIDDVPDVIIDGVEKEERLFIDRLSSSLGLEDGYKDALKDLLDPSSRLEISDVQVMVAGMLRKYIVDNYGDISSEALPMSSSERQVIRKLTGLFFNQAHQVDARKPQKLSDQVRNAYKNPGTGHTMQKDLGSGLEKLIAQQPPTKNADSKPTGTVIAEAVSDPKAISREVWLRAARSTVYDLAARLKMNDGLSDALWARSHKGESDSHKALTPAVRQALERIQNCMVSFSDEFSDKQVDSNKILRMFSLTAFGNPKDLDDIDARLFPSNRNGDSMAERHLVLVFQKMVSCLQDEKRGRA
jgi:hypothetical protein